MKLLFSRARQQANLEVMKRVLNEFDADKTVELRREAGADFLVWDQNSERFSLSISVAIPRGWLDNSVNASNLEATTRNFAAYVANSSKSRVEAVSRLERCRGTLSQYAGAPVKRARTRAKAPPVQLDGSVPQARDQLRRRKEAGTNRLLQVFP
jgi:hypothetical protein